MLFIKPLQKLVIAHLACLLMCTVPIHAAIAPTGDVLPPYNGSDDPWLVGSLTVGDSAVGALSIDDASVISSQSVSIGRQTDSTGTVTVNGHGSSLTNALNMVVGLLGNGNLAIAAGGTVTNDNGFIAARFRSTSEVMVTGLGSEWINSGEVSVGHEGNGTLRILSGGYVQSTESFIAGLDGSTGSATVSGSGSVWDSNDEMCVGCMGQGSLVIENAAQVYADIGRVGYKPDAVGSVTVSGRGSKWHTSVALSVGGDGDGGLNIEDSGAVHSGQVVIGGNEGSVGVISIVGSDSVLNSTGGLTVGDRGTGTLEIRSAANINVRRDTWIGKRIDNGPAVPGGVGLLQFDNGTLNTTGLLASPAELMGTGTINTSRLVSDVAVVLNANSGYQQLITLNSLPGQNITMNLDASGSAGLGAMGAGYRGVGSLLLADGLSLPSEVGYIGYHPNSNGTVTVSGAGSHWSNIGDLTVGKAGAGVMSIQQGATVSNLNGVVGDTIGGAYTSAGIVTVRDAGSLWQNFGALTIGLAGDADLRVEAAGLVVSNDGIIGEKSTSFGSVIVSETGSAWKINKELVVGRHGVGSLLIDNGGFVSSEIGRVGNSSASSSVGSVTVKGPGSAWINQGQLFVTQGSLSIEDSGRLSSQITTLNAFAGRTATVTVTGPGSTWNNSSFIIVASFGAAVLKVENAGEVNSGGGIMALNAGGSSTVAVKGPESAWRINGDLTIGAAGAGFLTITDSGLVQVSEDIRLGFNSSGSGTLTLSGGMLKMRNGQIVKGTGAANLVFTGGTLMGARVIDLGQPIVQAGGTLAPGNQIGLTRIVGDYTLTSGTVEIELGGVGNPLDLINVTGDIDIAALGTTLDLSALGGMPAGTYTVMQATGTVTGMFENIIGLELFGLNATAQNTGSAITITLASDLIFSDPNIDGFVGIEDLNIILSNWNQSVTPGDVLAGDLTGDGFVGIEDLNVVLGNWNTGTPPLIEALGAIPEPGTLCLLLAGCLISCGRRRHLLAS